LAQLANVGVEEGQLFDQPFDLLPVTGYHHRKIQRDDDDKKRESQKQERRRIVNAER